MDWDQQARNRAAQRPQQPPTNSAALERRLRENWWRDRTGSLEAQGQCRNPTDVRRARRRPNEAEAAVEIFQAATWLLARREIVVASLPEASRYRVGTTIRSALYLTRVVNSSTATS